MKEVGVNVELKPLTTVSDVKLEPVIVTGIDHVLPTIAIGGDRRAMAGALPGGVVVPVIVTTAGLLHIVPAHAVIFAVPALTPATTPLVLTVASALSDANEKLTPEITVMLELYAVAVSGTVLPTATVVVAGLSVTEATAGGGGGGGGLPPPEGLDGVAKLQPARTSVSATIENNFVFITSPSGGEGGI